MNEAKGLKLIQYLKNEPEKFYNEGKSYQLLQEYRKGLSIDTLSALFYFKNKWIRRVAIWITFEMGSKGGDLLKEVLTQINDNDIYICGYALGIVANYAYGDNINDFIRVFTYLEHDNLKVRLSVMNIISNLLVPRIYEAYVLFASQKKYSNSHEKGLLLLLNVNVLNFSEITQMINSDEVIIRKYGIIAAKKLYKKYPQIINEAVNNKDLDVREFSKIVKEVNIAFEQFLEF